MTIVSREIRAVKPIRATPLEDRMNIADVLRRQASARPDSPAYSCGVTTLSWSEVSHLSARLALWLSGEQHTGARDHDLTRTNHRDIDPTHAPATTRVIEQA